MFLWRSFLWCLMIALGVGAFYYADRSIEYGDKLESWKTANIVEFPIDLSKTGTYNASLKLVTATPCKVFFYVQIDDAVPAKRELLAGISGMISVTDDQNNEIAKLPIDAENCSDWPQNKGRLLPVIFSHPWGIGQYQMHMSITGPATQLKGIKHSFVMKYDLCGLEYMVQLVQRVIAAFFGLVGLIIGIYLFSTRKRKRMVPESEPKTV